MSEPTLKITSDFTKEFNATVKRFKQDAVLIGIPQDDNARKKDGPIGNAALLAINHFGSPARNIPARPVLTTGIRNAQAAIAEELKKCALKVLSDGPSALTTYYERAGSIASQACKKVINDQEGLEEPAQSTLRARRYLTASGFKGTKALLVTGQMRNAITYVLRSVWGR